MAIECKWGLCGIVSPMKSDEVSDEATARNAYLCSVAKPCDYVIVDAVPHFSSLTWHHGDPLIIVGSDRTGLLANPKTFISHKQNVMLPTHSWIIVEKLTPMPNVLQFVQNSNLKGTSLPTSHYFKNVPKELWCLFLSRISPVTCLDKGRNWRLIATHDQGSSHEENCP